MAGTENLRGVAIFYAIALGLAVVLALNAEAIGEGVLLLTMFTPLVAVIVVKLFVTRDGWKDLGLQWPGIRYWPAAVAMPLAVLLPGYLIVWGTGIGQFAGDPTPMVMARETVRFLVSLLIGTALGAFGEEIGWRGFMLPRLAHLGRMPASLITGFAHGVWHLPLILMTPFYHSGGDWWITVPLFLAALTLAGPVYGWLRFASASVWPAALAHRALNLSWSRLNMATVTERPVAVDYLAGETGLITILGLLVLTLLIGRIWRNQRADMAGQ